MDRNYIKALQIINKMINAKTIEISEIYKEFLQNEKNESSKIRTDVLTIGFNNALSRMFLAIIDLHYDKQKILKWINSELAGKKEQLNYSFKSYVMNRRELSLETLYHYYLLQEEFIKGFSGKDRIGIEPFVKNLIKPNTAINGVRKLPSNLEITKEEAKIQKSSGNDFSKKEELWALEYCEQLFLQIAEQNEKLDDKIIKIHIGYTPEGTPIFKQVKAGQKHVVFENGDRYYGRVFDLGDDNSPKEYSEPKGYEDLPYETEKDILK